MQDEIAPGLDGIPSEVLKVVCIQAEHATQSSQRMFNNECSSRPLEGSEAYADKQGQKGLLGVISVSSVQYVGHSGEVL